MQKEQEMLPCMPFQQYSIKNIYKPKNLTTQKLNITCKKLQESCSHQCSWFDCRIEAHSLHFQKIKFQFQKSSFKDCNLDVP